jgi:hypothetical protein
VVEQNKSGDDDGADAPWTQADPRQRLEGGLEQRVRPIGLGAQVA